MFGNPPLMTPAFRPPAAMLGEWRATTRALPAPASGTLDVVFIIHSHGSVTGSIGDATLVDGRIAYNRSWFGRLMRWRDDYAMRGRYIVRGSDWVAGDQFTAALMSKGQDLDGSPFLRGQPLRVALRKE